MSKKNKEIESIYFKFLETYNKKNNIQLALLKVPVDKLKVKDMGSTHILKVIEKKFNVSLQELINMGWGTAPVKKLRKTFYLIPPSLRRRKRDDEENFDLEL